MRRPFDKHIDNDELDVPCCPGEKRPYRLDGGRLMKVGGKAAAFIAYQMQTGPVSLMVTPDSVAVAFGGVAADFKKVSFHYRTVEGYQVVTWSLHRQTYALVPRREIASCDPAWFAIPR